MRGFTWNAQSTYLFQSQVNARIGQAELFMFRLAHAPETPVSGGARLAGGRLAATLEPAGVVRFMPDSLLPQVSEVDKQVSHFVMLCWIVRVSEVDRQVKRSVMLC